MTDNIDIYGGEDPWDIALYTYSEAAKILDIPSSTLRAWTVGQYYTVREERRLFAPVIKRPSADDTRLSFANLLEAFVVRALRVEYDVALHTIREALDIAQHELQISRLLIHPQLSTSGGELLLDQVFQLEQLSRHRQLVIREVVESYLKRVEWDRGDHPLWLFPWPRRPRHDPESTLIGINVRISFGRPLIASVGVSTEIIALRVDAGESPEAIMRDYGLSNDEFFEALHFEGKRRAA